MSVPIEPNRKQAHVLSLSPSSDRRSINRAPHGSFIIDYLLKGAAIHNSVRHVAGAAGWPRRRRGRTAQIKYKKKNGITVHLSAAAAEPRGSCTAELAGQANRPAKANLNGIKLNCSRF
ncbi:hypothetical protein ABZP36_014345 [Zizania latifolia]